MRFYSLLTLASLPIVLSHNLVGQASSSPPRIIAAQRLTESIKVDGQLIERAWQQPGWRGLIQREPQEGAPASEETEFWVAYDEHALYVAARMYDTRPDSIIGRFARRDENSESDRISIAIDASFDRRTAYYFVVNPAGAIEDGTISNDTHRDARWDGVWDVAVQVDDDGWTAEFRIPFSQLRFPERDRYVWGFELSRRIQRKNEESYLVLHPRDDFVRVSRWTELHGIEGIKPPSRVELLPYIAATGKFIERPPAASFNAGRTDPFVFGRDYLLNLGADAKIGLSGDMTLDVTLNPDFAQVEVDPAVVNLTAYEIRFDEKRPFFVEGSNILRFGRGGAAYLQDFNWRDPSFFYSRRIGRAPQGSVTRAGFHDIPDRTTILGASKLSGKITDTWSIATLAAVTEREYGHTDSAGVRFSEEVEPLTFYGVVRSLKEFNGARQAIGFLATIVERDLREPRLKDILNSRAASFGVDGWIFLDHDRMWVVTGWAGGSTIAGTERRLTAVQRSPQHYFQRPDAEHVSVDPNATSMTGWASRVWLDKVKGNWIFNAAIGAVHPRFELNDIGFHTSTDQINMHIYGGYAWYEPDAIFRTKQITAAVYRDYNFGNVKVGETAYVDVEGRLLNYWAGSVIYGRKAETFDDKRTRGGPLMKSLQSDFLYLTVVSDTRLPFSGFYYANGSSGVAGEWHFNTGLSLNWKASRTLSIRVRPDFYRLRNIAQYIAARSDPAMTETYGVRYIFGTLDQKLLSATMRLDWAFTPTLSLQLFLQPLLSTGSYSDIKELAQAGTFTFNRYGHGSSTIRFENNRYVIDPDGGLGPAPAFQVRNPDFNFKSLRANAVLRWEYSPGSTFYFVWTNQKVNFENHGKLRFGQDIETLMRDRPDNVFAVKMTYWWGR
jgi:hypothetical protein